MISKKYQNNFELRSHMKIENNSWRVDRIQIRLLWQIIYTYWSSKPFRKVTNNSNTFFIYWNKDNKVFMKEKNENWDFIFQRHHKMHTNIFSFETLLIMNDWYTTLTHHVSCKEKNDKCELCGKVCCTTNTYPLLWCPQQQISST